MGATTTVVSKHQRCLKHTVPTSLAAKGEDTSHSAIITTEPIFRTPTVTTSLSAKRQPAEPSAVITTAEFIAPTKQEPTVLMSAGVPPVKRSRHEVSHTIMTLSNEMEYNEFFRCGTSINGVPKNGHRKNTCSKAMERASPLLIEPKRLHLRGDTRAL